MSQGPTKETQAAGRGTAEWVALAAALWPLVVLGAYLVYAALAILPLLQRPQ